MYEASLEVKTYEANLLGMTRGVSKRPAHTYTHGACRRSTLANAGLNSELCEKDLLAICVCSLPYMLLTAP